MVLKLTLIAFLILKFCSVLSVLSWHDNSFTWLFQATDPESPTLSYNIITNFVGSVGNPTNQLAIRNVNS